MRIDLNNPIARQFAAEANGKKAGRPEPSPLSSEDKASFSHSGLSVQSLMASALSPSSVRDERVAALRDAVSSGKYSVDAEAVADAMIRESSGK
jgi:flagellar biosynthesis anti-sigma factor FlgM